MFLFEQFMEVTNIQQPPQQAAVVQQPQQVVQQTPQRMVVSQQPSEEEYDNEDYAEDDLEDEEMPEESADATPPEFIPLKKYFLIQRLQELQSRLKSCNITDEDLNTVLKFADDLSYNSLLVLANSLIEYLEEKIARLTNGETT